MPRLSSDRMKEGRRPPAFSDWLHVTQSRLQVMGESNVGQHQFRNSSGPAARQHRLATQEHAEQWLSTTRNQLAAMNESKRSHAHYQRTGHNRATAGSRCSPVASQKENNADPAAPTDGTKWETALKQQLQYLSAPPSYRHTRMTPAPALAAAPETSPRSEQGAPHEDWWENDGPVPVCSQA